MYYLAIPKDRVAVLIGPSGSTKKRIEQLSGTRITVDKDGKVTIEGDNSLKCFKVKDLIKAIGRGFNPERAEKLLNDDFCFDLIDIKGSQKDKERLRGRIIGKGGKMRKYIERRLNCEVSVFRDTVGIIGHEDTIGACREATEMLILGSMHTSVYRFIEKYLQNL
jgi:ribosomal RNA assembly protein